MLYWKKKGEPRVRILHSHWQTHAQKLFTHSTKNSIKKKLTCLQQRCNERIKKKKTYSATICVLQFFSLPAKISSGFFWRFRFLLQKTTFGKKTTKIWKFVRVSGARTRIHTYTHTRARTRAQKKKIRVCIFV